MNLEVGEQRALALVDGDAATVANVHLRETSADHTDSPDAAFQRKTRAPGHRGRALRRIGVLEPGIAGIS